MYALNYAGAVFNKSYLPSVIELIEKSYAIALGHFHVQPGGDDKVCSSVVCNSIDSTAMSSLIVLLDKNNIPHRLFSVPHYDERVVEDLTTTGLIIHHPPCDKRYTFEWDEGNKAALLWCLPDAYSTVTTIDKIVLVGPNYETRRVQRWIDFNLRTGKLLDNKILAGIKARLVHGKVYLKMAEEWTVIKAHVTYVVKEVNDKENAHFKAKVNGLVSYEA